MNVELFYCILNLCFSTTLKHNMPFLEQQFASCYFHILNASLLVIKMPFFLSITQFNVKGHYDYDYTSLLIAKWSLCYLVDRKTNFHISTEPWKNIIIKNVYPFYYHTFLNHLKVDLFKLQLSRKIMYTKISRMLLSKQHKFVNFSTLLKSKYLTENWEKKTLRLALYSQKTELDQIICLLSV